MIYERASSVMFYAEFLDWKGSPATISGTPTITINHYAGSLKTDVSSSNMTNLSGSKYYYEYHIPANADKTDYLVTYSAIYSDGTNVNGNEGFYVIDRNFYDRSKGSFTRVVAKGLNDEDKNYLDSLFESISEKMKSLKPDYSEIKNTIINNKDYLDKNISEKFDFVLDNNSGKVDVVNERISVLSKNIEEMKNMINELQTYYVKSLSDNSIDGCLSDDEK